MSARHKGGVFLLMQLTKEGALLEERSKGGIIGERVT